MTTTQQPIIELDAVSFSYGTTRALVDVSVRIGPGEFVAVVGQNGSGKTTMAKHFNGLLRPDEGRVLIDGQDSRTQSIGQLARTTGYVFQNPDHQIFLPTVAEELAYGPSNLGVDGAELDARVSAALTHFGLEPLRDHHPTLLGRGLRRRVALAAVWAMQPRVLVLDEPTGGLDRRATQELMTLLKRMVAEGQSVVVITHDMRLVADHLPRTIALHAGRIIADGPTRDVLADDQVLKAAGLIPPPVMRLAAELAPHGIPSAATVDEFCRAFADRYRAGSRTSPAGSPRQRSAE